MANGLDTMLGSSTGSRLDIIRNVICKFIFTELAVVDKVNKDKRTVDCSVNKVKYTGVEVLSIGGNGVKLNVLPAEGDVVLIIVPHACVPDVDNYKALSSAFAYDAGGTKCIPLGTSKDKVAEIEISGSDSKIKIDNGKCSVTMGSTILLQGRNGKLEVS